MSTQPPKPPLKPETADSRPEAKPGVSVNRSMWEKPAATDVPAAPAAHAPKFRPVRLLKYYLISGAPLVLVIAGGFAFEKFVVHAVMTNVVLNMIILGTALAGALTMLLRVKGVGLEWRAFNSFHAALEDEEPWSSQPKAKRFEKAHSYRLLEHLSALRGGQISSTINQTHVHDEFNDVHAALESRQEPGQYLVGLMIALGLLGTFIGLLETLVAVGELIGGFANMGSGSLDEAFKILLGNLQRPLTAMGTAFSASMFGLIGSLVLGLMLLGVRACQANFLQYGRGVIGEMTDAAEKGADTKGDDANLASWLKSQLGDLFEYQRRFDVSLREQAQLTLSNEKRQAALVTALEKLAAAQQQRNESGEVLLMYVSELPRVLDTLRSLASQSEQQVKSANEQVGHLTNLRTELPVALLDMGQQLQSHATKLQEDQARMFSQLLSQLIGGSLDKRLSDIEVLMQKTGAQGQDAALARQTLAVLTKSVSSLDGAIRDGAGETRTLLTGHAESIGALVRSVNESSKEIQRISALVQNPTTVAQTDEGHQLILRDLSRMAEQLQREFRMAARALTDNRASARPHDAEPKSTGENRRPNG